MDQKPNVVFEKSYIRKIGLKNLVFCAGWFLVSAFIFLNGYWVDIQKFIFGMQHSISDGAGDAVKGLASIFGAIASAFSFGLFIGWVVSLPLALLMIITGYYPRFFKSTLCFKPECNSDNSVSRERKLQDVWAENRPTGKDYSIENKHDEHKIDDENIQQPKWWQYWKW